MFHVLLVEDTESCILVVKRALANPEVKLTAVTTVTEAMQILKSQSVDMVLLDLMLPDGDGLDVLNYLQTDEEMRHKPVILMTQKNDLASKVSAFSLGADDYLTKPVDPIELKARVEMHLRKRLSQRKELESLRKGALTINIPKMQVMVQKEGREEPVELTAKEFKILAHLAQHEGTVFSRSDLVKAIWSSNTHVVDRTVDSHVCGVRRKIEPFAEYIEAVPGSGYRLVVKDL